MNVLQHQNLRVILFPPLWLSSNPSTFNPLISSCWWLFCDTTEFVIRQNSSPCFVLLMNVEQKLTPCSRCLRRPRSWRRLERLHALRVPLKRRVYRPTAPVHGTGPAAVCQTTRPRRRSIITCETARGALSCMEDVWTGLTSPTGTETVVLIVFTVIIWIHYSCNNH